MRPRGDSIEVLGSLTLPQLSLMWKMHKDNIWHFEAIDTKVRLPKASRCCWLVGGRGEEDRKISCNAYHKNS